ncbi:16452_t:CDS:1 [Funneliformis mosseae]|uniref:16452_t:CDS:1 n=1 Tax=Funneliformis mosseae TaxID=27381 RepID=A0A9N9EKI6_FUNMO|nr:16452_t:CDS:1 [Funneliformis mosseae]
MEIDDEYTKIKKKKENSEIDKIKEYSIIKDLGEQKANITFKQLIKESKKIEQELKNVIKRPVFQELKNIEKEHRKLKRKIDKEEDIFNLKETYKLNEYEVRTDKIMEKLYNRIEESKESENNNSDKD